MNDATQTNETTRGKISSAGSFGIGTVIGGGAALGGMILMGAGLIATAFIGTSAFAMGAVLTTSPLAAAIIGDAVAGITGLATAGATAYGGYRAVRAVNKMIKNNKRLDDTWTPTGMAFGFAGLVGTFLMADSFVTEPTQPETNPQKITEEKPTTISLETELNKHGVIMSDDFKTAIIPATNNNQITVAPQNMVPAQTMALTA